MECQALQKLLNSAWWITREDSESDEQCDMREKLTAHLSSCPLCKKSILHISLDMLSEDALPCEECCLLLPKYYEVTHSIRNDLHVPFMKASDIIEVAIHLSVCASCRISYKVLAKLWDEDLL